MGKYLFFSIVYLVTFLCLYFEPEYSITFNEDQKVCDWAVYNLSYENLNTPDRKGKFADFYNYKNVKPSDYANELIDRGHLIPYFSMGGDRNNDGKVDDEYELSRYKIINSPLNLAPQFKKFNEAKGSWYNCEVFIRDKVITKERSAKIYVGTIFGPKDFRKLKSGIGIPPAFYQIIIVNDQALAFLFPHQNNPHHNLYDYIVSIDLIESLSGHDFPLDDYNEKNENIELYEGLLNEK